MTLPEDFAAEWRAEERRRKARALAESLQSAGVFPPLAGLAVARGAIAAAVELERERLEQRALAVDSELPCLPPRDFLRHLRVLAQAERLSAWGPWR